MDRIVEHHVSKIFRSAARGDVQEVAAAAKSAAENQMHSNSSFWRAISRGLLQLRNWDILLAGLYAEPAFRRSPQYLDLALVPRWPRNSRVAEHLPYPHIVEMSRRMVDLGYVPDDVLVQVSSLSSRFPEMLALERYARRNSKYAFRVLLTDDSALKTYLRFVHAWENVFGRVPGKSVVKNVHRIFPDLLAHRRLVGGDFERLLTGVEDIPSFTDVLRADLQRHVSSLGVADFVAEPEDRVHIPRFLEYLSKYRGSILRLPRDPSALFSYKFAHISPDISERALRIREHLKATAHIVPLFDPLPLLQSLETAALEEGLRAKDSEYAALLRSAYEKIRKGELQKITAEELKAVSQKGISEREGLSETRRLLQKAIDKHATSSGYLALAGTVPEHFAALSVGGSCYAPGHGHFTLGAVGTTGGPALVFYVKHPVTGEARAHQVYNLHFDRKGSPIFVPNDVYGTDNYHLAKITRNVLREFGLRVHEGSDLNGLRPAPSRHDIRDFYSDIIARPSAFPALRRK